MKKLFMAIFIPIMFVLGTPALLGAIMYDGSGDVHMPIHLYTEDADAEEMVYAELSASIADVKDNVTEDMVYELHQDIINTAIFELFSSENMNPDYMPTDDCNDDSCNYVFAEVLPVEGYDIGLRVVGAWVDFEDDKFITNLFLEVSLDDGFTYKTIIQLHFLFHDYADRYELEFDKIQIGNLPIPKSMITSIMGTLDDQLDQVDLEDSTDELELGEFDINELKYTLQKDEILAKLSEGQDGEEPDTGAALAQEVLSIIFDNELINFSFEEDKFVLTAGVSKFRSDETDIPDYLYDLHFVTMVDDVEVYGEFDPDSFDPESYLADKFTEYVFNSALVGGGFEIHEKTFNKLIYYGADGFSETRETYEYTNEDGELEVIDIGLKAIWFELAPGDIYVNALFRIAGIDSIIQIKAEDVTPVESTTELVFEFTEITFGKDVGEVDGDYLSIIDLTVFKDMFAELGDVEFGEFDENGVLTISTERLSALMQDGSQEGTVNVTGIHLIQDAIVLDIEPADAVLAEALDAFTEELNNVMEDPALLEGLEDALDIDTPGPEQDVYNNVVDLQDALANDEPIETEDITEMFDNFEQMDTESQEAFLETFNDLIDPAVYDQFQDLYDQQAGTEE